MLKLNAVYKDYIWGGEKLKMLFGKQQEGILAESWEVSVHPDGLSTLGDQTFASYLANNPTAVDKLSSPFGILIKYIDAKTNLSVQVHPDEAFARQVEQDNGKTECWYVVDADPGAGIYCGFNQDVDKADFLRSVQDGSVEKYLNFIPVQKGDCFMIFPGTVHSICGGCVICEVQQSSNITYRVYDYNRIGADGKKRPLQVEKAMQVINFAKYDSAKVLARATPLTACNVACNTNGNNTIRQVGKCEHFDCKELTLCGSAQIGCDDAYVAINVVQGEGQIDGQQFVAGDTFFLDCAQKVAICGNATVLLTTK